jgi:adenylate cyclase
VRAGAFPACCRTSWTNRKPERAGADDEGRRVKKHFVRFALGLVIVFVFIGHAADWYRIPFVDTLEAIAYDTRLRLTMPRGVDQRIVIVDIDERSLAIEGRWPWRRDRLALFLDRLFDQYKIKVLGFDVVFAERDESSGLKVLEGLAQDQLSDNAPFQSALKTIAPSLEFDRMFAERMRGRPVVLGYYFTDRKEVANVLPEPVLPKGTFQGRNVTPIRYSGYGSNLAQLMEAATNAGHFNPDPDPDGVTRRVPMLAEYGGAYYEPLSLAVLRLLEGSPKVIPVFTEAPLVDSKKYPGLEWLEVGSKRIPVDIDVTTLVPYRGREHSFPYVSAADVLHGKIDPAILADRIVLVGTTTPGLQDLRSTPVGPVYPGVEIHANLIAGMLDGVIKQRPPYVLGAEVSLLFLSGVVMALVLPLLNPLRATLVTALVLVAVYGTNVLVWDRANLVLPLASGVLMIGLLFALNMSYGFFVESRAKRQITGRFGQYVPPELVDEMSQNPENFSMEGESRDMSVLFTDVRGFTTISEGLDPKELSRLMNEFLTPLTQVIYRHRGTIDKYMGDCIMAFWGAPLQDPKHAHNTLLAGMEMLATMDALQPQFKSRGWPELHIGVGVNTGRMSVGNMGSEIRVAYTVMGDAVNLASRLEGLTKQYGVGIIVGENTRAGVADVAFRELDRVRAKGKKEPVAIFEPVGPSSELDKPRKDELSLWHQALKQYRAQEWDMAELQLINLQQRYPATALYGIFLQRITHFRANPPGAGWDGTWAFETK